MKNSDFELLFRASPYPCLVMDNDLIIISANNAYLQAVDKTREDIVGKHIFDAFPENRGDPDSTRIHEVKASLETAIASRQPQTVPFVRYAVAKKTTEGIVFEERFWSVVHSPALDDEGNVAFVFQNAIDITDLYRIDKDSGSLPMALAPPNTRRAGHFSRAQMHEAMARILNDERGHLRNLFNQSPGFVAVLTGPRHVFQMVNQAYYELVGHRDILGKPALEALPELAGQGYEELLNKVYTTGEPWIGRATPISLQREKDGPVSQRYVDLSYQPYRAGDGSIIGIFAQGYDVTDTVEAQAAQRDSEERLREGMLAAKMVVWDWEIASRKMVFSDNVLQILGVSADNIDTLYNNVHPQDAIKMRDAHRRAIAERSGYQEVIRFTRPDNGKMIWNEVHGKVRCDSSGNPFSIRGVTVDITDRIQAEEELREADRRKDEFLAMLAHELRNPLAPISAAAELMRMVKLDENRVRQTSDIITRQINHMTGLVDDLIDVSRVTRGLVTIEKEPLDVKRIISDAIEQTGPIIESKRHHLRMDLSPQAARISGDQKRLVQVLTNILNNAAKYTPVGGNIALKMEVEDNYVSISVIDDGIGISASLLPRVFDLFTQAERTVDRSQGGLGLGLALVKSLVELHGGKVNASSDGPGKGSKFVVCLPRLHEQDAQDENGQRDELRNTARKALRIMIVDDNEDAAQMLAMFLETSGHTVLIEHGALTALEHARTQVPDVYLLDIGLPDMDGNELARRLRSQPETSGAILVAITGYGQEQDRIKTKAAGFDHHLVKPVNTSGLMKILDDVASH